MPIIKRRLVGNEMLVFGRSLLFTDQQYRLIDLAIIRHRSKPSQVHFINGPLP